MKNLRRKNELHYFKKMRFYIPKSELRKQPFYEFHDMSLVGYKGIYATMAKF